MGSQGTKFSKIVYIFKWYVLIYLTKFGKHAEYILGTFT